MSQRSSQRRTSTSPASTQRREKKKKDKDRKGKPKKVSEGSKSIDVNAEADAEAEVQAVRQRKLDKEKAERERQQAAATVAQITQAIHRGNLDREALGARAGASKETHITEKLHLWEQTKATVFVVANVFTALFGLVCSISIYRMRLADGSFETAGTNTSAQLMFIIVFGLFVCSVIGIYGAVYLKLGHLRFYAFFLMLLICAQLSTIMVLVLEVSSGSGAFAQVGSAAAQQLKLETATALREQYCELKTQVDSYAYSLLGANYTDGNSQAACKGRYQTDSTGSKLDVFEEKCPGLSQDEGPGCAAVGMVDCHSACIPAYSISDEYCRETFEKQLTENIELDRIRALCPVECNYEERTYTTDEFNVTDIQANLDLTSVSIWGGTDSHSMCDCNPSQETDEEKTQFLDCMHAFSLKNLGLVIIVIAAVLFAEAFLGIFGWTMLRPWAERRLEKLGSRANSHNERSKHWNVVAAFALPETEEDIARKEMAIVTETWYFEGTVIGVVTLSMYVLAMTSPTVPPPDDEILALRMMEVFVTVFLTMELFMEMVVTIKTKRHETYVKNPWHWVDYFVLVVSWMYLLDPDNQFTAVCRALRVVRPMRSVSLFSSFKLIGDCLKDDADIFVDVTAFTVLMIFTFSLVGLTSYHGSLQYTCGIPVNPFCPEELDGICGVNETWSADPGAVVDLRTPRESWTQETGAPGPEEEGVITQRLIEEGKLEQHPGLDYYLLTGVSSVELPSSDILEYVYGNSWETRDPQGGIPCPTTLNCGRVKDKQNPGWWQVPFDDQDEPRSRCFKLNPPRVLTEDKSGRRGFDDISQGFITFLVSMSGDGGMEQVPSGLLEAGATSAYLAWPFFFVVSVLLNFVTLNLLLAMCVATLENVNAEFRKVEKDKLKTKRLQKHGAEVRRRRVLSVLPITNPVPELPGGVSLPGSSKVNQPVEKAIREIDSKIIETGDKILAGFDDFEAERTAMEEALQTLDWTGKRFGKFRNECKTFVLSGYYRNGVVIMVLAWTATLMFKTGIASKVDNLTEEQVEVLTRSFNKLELMLLIGFILEVLIKMSGIGWKLFKRNHECILDLAFLVITCVAFSTSYFGFTIEFHCRAQQLATMINGTVDPLEREASVAICVERTISDDTRKMFQMLRVAQIARMLYKHESIYAVMQKIFKNWKAIIGVLLFVIFSMCMFSIVGMHLLGQGRGYGSPFEHSGLCCTDSAPDEDEEGTLYFRSNFETFWDGMLSTIQIILGDDWMLIMLWYMNNSSMKEYSGITAIFFTAAFLWVFGVLFNLFVAVLLINFGVDEDDKMPKQKEVFWRGREHKERVRKRRVSTHSEILALALKADAAQEEIAQPAKNKGNAHNVGEIDLVKALEADLDPNHKSLFLFKSSTSFRVGAARIETSPWFLRGMIGLIFTSMTLLALEDEDVLESGTWETRTKLVEYSVWLYFLAEMVLKSISSGFIFKSGPSTPYLGNQRNRNDFAFVVLAAMTAVPSITTYLRAEHGVQDRHLRLLRGMGPMVGLLQSREIRIVTGSFYSCLPGVATVMVPMIFVLLMFALLGFELYNGRLRRCMCPLPGAETGGDEVFGLQWCSPDGEALECSASPVAPYTADDPCYGYGNQTVDYIEINNRTACVVRGYKWGNDPVVGGFDDVFSAVATLFKGSTTGATDLLYVSMDAAYVKDGLPGRNQNPNAAIFLTVFHAVFTMFLLNIFIGVMSSTFSIQTGKATETDGQKRWKQLVKDVTRFSPTYSAEERFRPEENARWYKWRLKAFEFASHYVFNFLCIAMVVGNTILLITEHYPASTSYIRYTDLLNLFFITWFAFEFLAKLAGFGPKNYFSDGWLVFDFLVISSTWAIRFSSSTAAGMDLFKVARCMKIFLLAKRLATLVDLMHVVAACITKASNVAIIMLVITYIYAITGMKLYGAAAMLPQTNFSDFPHAMKLLIQVVTGQSYGKIIALLMAEGYAENGALVYFISYYSLSVFICTNLFIVTVLDNFDVASRSGQVIKSNEFWGFTYAWADLTVGAHAVPVLAGTQALGFVKKLRTVVEKKKAETNVSTVSVKIKNIPANMARAEILEEKFSEYGEIENIEVRKHQPFSGAYITFKHKDLFKRRECFEDKIYVGKDLQGEPNLVEVQETRHGDFPHGIVSISLPDNKRKDRGTLQFDILRGDGIRNGVQPYIKVTSVAKHLHHGGRHVSKLTRSINRNNMVEDATGLPSVIVLAPPGAQKYRYCRQVAKRYGLVHIDVGEMLREEEANNILKLQEDLQEKGAVGNLSPGSKTPENWFISQEEAATERQAEEAARAASSSDGDSTPSSNGALTPGRKHRMGRADKLRSMGHMDSNASPEHHLKSLKSHVQHHPALHSGKLVADKHVLPLIRARIEQAEANDQGFILSGFPRTKRQANQLKAMHAIPAVVVVLDIDETECYRGCQRRRIDPKNGKVYDLDLNPPRNDVVRNRVVSRRDDHDPKIIDARLKRFTTSIEATVDALGRFMQKDRLYRLTVDTRNPSETLQDMFGLMEVSFGDATQYNAAASPSAPVPAEWNNDKPLYFHVNEHSRRYDIEIFDAAKFSLEPFGKCSIELPELIAMSHFVEDRDVDWSDEGLDDLLSMKSLNPINAMATLNSTIKEAEKLGHFAMREAEKAAEAVKKEAAKAAELALETVGLESNTLESIAEDGAKTHALELKDSDGNITCTLHCQLRFHSKEWVPDWNFISEFGDDNPNLKPSSCGIEGWIEQKETDKSGSYKGKWVYITKHPPQLCVLNVSNEMELRNMMKGKRGRVPDNLVKRIQPHEIHQLRNGFSRRRAKPRKSESVSQAREEDCHFEFMTVDEINHEKQGMHSGAQSPTRRHGVLHVQVVEAKGLPHMDSKGDTDAYVYLDFEEVQYKTAAVHDTIEPIWNEACSFSVFEKSNYLMLSIFDEDAHSKDDIIGKVTVDISDLEEDQPRDVWLDISVAKHGNVKSPPKSMWSGDKTSLGQVRLILSWASAENAEVLLQRWTEDDLANNRLREAGTAWRFRAASPEVKYSWLQAIAWVERGCEGATPPKIVAPRICDEDMKLVENDPSTVDLPIAKCRHLLYNLREFECLGLKDGRDAALYATFQLELHAWKKVYHKDKRRKNSGAGASVDSFHGLDFYRTLERLCLLRYGKAKSLSYHQLMDEYEHERAHVALHTIQTCILAWIYHRRGSNADRRRYIHRMWKTGHKDDGELLKCYFHAVTQVKILRLKCLANLTRLVKKQDPDIWHGKWDPTKVKQTREEKKRARQQAKEEAKQAKREQKEIEFNERHNREVAAQKARADDVLAVRRSGRHNDGGFENPLLFSESDDEGGEGSARSPRGVSAAHLAPRTALTPQARKGDSTDTFDIEERTLSPTREFEAAPAAAAAAAATASRNLYSSDEDET
eukprot:COSAG02_NODE_1484_length_12382_cov_6.377758_2_plen_3395_part_00